MDPLQRLAEKNRKHAVLEKKERNGNLKYYPLAFLFLILYAGGYYLYFSHEESILGFEFWEMSKQVWLISITVTAGIGALFLSGSLAFVIWSNIFVKELGGKVRSIRSGVFPFIFLFISALFFIFAKWLNLLIIENNMEIYNFLRFGYRETPFLIEMFLNYVIGFIVVVFIILFMFIFTIPFKAKRHAKEFASNNTP